MFRSRHCLSFVFAILGLTSFQSVNAETYESTQTGYTFMAGATAYASTSASHSKSYFLAQPLNYDFSGANYWGYGWTQFDHIGATEVMSAYLNVSLLGIGSMAVTPASEANPAHLDLYDPGDVDLTTLLGNGSDDGYDLRTSLRAAMDADSPMALLTMTSNGAQSIDITDLYNRWVAAGNTSHGILFSSPDNGNGGRFASFGSTAGAPTIITTAVPEPSAMVLIALAFVGLGIARLARSKQLPRKTVVALILGVGSLLSATSIVSAASNAQKVGILLVSHGSRSDAWRKMLTDIEDTVRADILKDGKVTGIRSAFMEYKEPSIATQLKAFDAEGYTDVILVPLLLTVSSHSFDDIPTIIGQKQDRHTLDTLQLEGIEVYKPKARLKMAPLLDFPVVLQKNVVRRVQEMSKSANKEGVVLVVYGSTEYEQEWKQMVDRVGRELRKETGIDCVEHAWCGHIVHYKSEPTEKAIRSVLEKKERALVVPLLVAVDETFQGRIIGGAVKKVNANDRIVYRRDAILPDANVNHWVVAISQKLVAEIATP
jgi:sirohydrochlorin ferrochelatase